MYLYLFLALQDIPDRVRAQHVYKIQEKGLAFSYCRPYTCMKALGKR